MGCEGRVYFQPYIDALVSNHSAELRRLRIAHLRRMAELAMEWADFTRPMTQRGKLYRFAKRCDNEIARLRAEA